MGRTARLLSLLLLSVGAAILTATTGLMASPQSGPLASGQSQSATLRSVAATAPDIPLNDSEWQSEQELLALANQSRRQAGLPPLSLDSGLSQAARAHAQTMVEAHRLSHQFQGEPSLPLRLASSSPLMLDQAGENVAFDADAQHSHEHLMLSPPHRANLLNPTYNVVGLGVVRGADRLYIVQDFGHALPNYSPDEVKERIAMAVEHRRHQITRSHLSRRDLPNADDAACSMAHADGFSTSPIHTLAEHFTVLTFTSLHPETLPRQATHAIANRRIRSFSVGTCYARTETYPSGAYWVVLSLE